LLTDFKTTTYSSHLKLIVTKHKDWTRGQ